MHPGETRWRPEFDVLPAFNPRSQVIGVNRKEGLTFTVLAPGALEEGSFVAGMEAGGDRFYCGGGGKSAVVRAVAKRS